MSTMLRDTPLSPAEIDALIDANAAALGLTVTTAQRPGVQRYFALAAEMAAQVNGLPLAHDDDAAGIFVPVEPE